MWLPKDDNGMKRVATLYGQRAATCSRGRHMIIVEGRSSTFAAELHGTGIQTQKSQPVYRWMHPHRQVSFCPRVFEDLGLNLGWWVLAAGTHGYIVAVITFQMMPIS